MYLNGNLTAMAIRRLPAVGQVRVAREASRFTDPERLPTFAVVGSASTAGGVIDLRGRFDGLGHGW